MSFTDWLFWGVSGSKSLARIMPFLINKLIYKDLNETRPALYPSTYSSSISSFFSECDHIIDNIYLGSSYNASNYDLIQNLDIYRIVNVSDDVPNFFESDINLEYYYHNIKDNGIDIFDKNELDLIFDFIKKNDNNVLVHCVVGRSRSVTIVIYYLIKEHGMDVDTAINFIKSKRSVINPSLRLINSIKNIKTEKLE